MVRCDAVTPVAGLACRSRGSGVYVLLGVVVVVLLFRLFVKSRSVDVV
jgi:hypothetical protein